jgi:hypothetical protein
MFNRGQEIFALKAGFTVTAILMGSILIVPLALVFAMFKVAVERVNLKIDVYVAKRQLELKAKKLTDPIDITTHAN